MVRRWRRARRARGEFRRHAGATGLGYTDLRRCTRGSSKCRSRASAAWRVPTRTGPPRGGRRAMPASTRSARAQDAGLTSGRGRAGDIGPRCRRVGTLRRSRARATGRGQRVDGRHVRRGALIWHGPSKSRSASDNSLAACRAYSPSPRARILRMQSGGAKFERMAHAVGHPSGVRPAVRAPRGMARSPGRREQARVERGAAARTSSRPRACWQSRASSAGPSFDAEDCVRPERGPRTRGDSCAPGRRGRRPHLRPTRSSSRALPRDRSSAGRSSARYRAGAGRELGLSQPSCAIAPEWRVTSARQRTRAPPEMTMHDSTHAILVLALNALLLLPSGRSGSTKPDGHQRLTRAHERGRRRTLGGCCWSRLPRWAYAVAPDRLPLGTARGLSGLGSPYYMRRRAGTRWRSSNGKLLARRRRPRKHTDWAAGSNADPQPIYTRSDPSRGRAAADEMGGPDGLRMLLLG